MLPKLVGFREDLRHIDPGLIHRHFFTRAGADTLIGTNFTFLVFSGLLLVVALVGIWRSAGWRTTLPWLWMPVVLLLESFLLAGDPIKTTTGQIYETESAYNYIQVLEQDGFHLLRLNEGQGCTLSGIQMNWIIMAPGSSSWLPHSSTRRLTIFDR